MDQSDMPGMLLKKFALFCGVSSFVSSGFLRSAARNKDDTPGPCQYTPNNPNVISERRSIGEKTGVMLVIAWHAATRFRNKLCLSNALVANDVFRVFFRSS